MTSGSSAGPRVLVIDDSAEMRAITSRVLDRAGYRVDLASTLGEARELDPGGYDAVIVDARLGEERGTDLIDELGAADPGALRRCLIITGGAQAPLPAGVPMLTKPFQLPELLTAVRALLQPETPRDPTAPGDDGPGGAKHRGEKHAPPAATPEPNGASRASGTNTDTTWRLLRLAGWLRARERAGLADFLHDGPIQDLAAASLELQLLRRSAGPAQAPQLDAVLRRLEAVARPLRVVVDEAAPPLVTQHRLAHTLKQRAVWLGVPLAVATNAECADLAAAEMDAAVTVAELMLLVMTPGAAPAQAEVEVQAEDGLIEIRLALAPAAADLANGDRTTAYQALRELAAALAITMGSEFGRWRWRAWTSMPRPVPQGHVPQGHVPQGQGSGMATAAVSRAPSQVFPDQALPRPRGLNAVTWP
jgi:CheY-like chemotaxis protein